MKKIAIALFLSAILGTSVLAGCSPKEETPAPDTTKEEAAPEAEQPAAEEEFAVQPWRRNFKHIIFFNWVKLI